MWVVVQAAGKGTVFDSARVGEGSDHHRSVEPLSFRLQDAAPLKGRITDSLGKPVVGAVVGCCEISCLPLPITGILSAVTDQDGRYEINDLPPFDVDDIPPQPVFGLGTMSVISCVATVEHPDFAQGIIEYSKLPATQDIVLQAPAKLRGQIRLENDEPATDAWVEWTYENGLSSTVSVDAAGKYSLDRLWPGKYTIEAKRKDRLPTIQQVTLASGENALDISLKSGGIVKGRIIDDSTGKTPDPRLVGVKGDIQANVDGRPENATHSWFEDDATFVMAVQPGKNRLLYPNVHWRLADLKRWAVDGIEVADGQTVEIELRVKPRNGGFASVMAEMEKVAAMIKAETEPAPPAPQLEDKFAFDTEGEDNFTNTIMNWPEELRPKKPLSEKGLMSLLTHPDFAMLQRRQIDGQEEIVTISLEGSHFHPDHDEDRLGQFIWLEYSVFAHIAKFPHLETLCLMGTLAEDKWLESLRGNTHLNTLMLSYSRSLTAGGAAHLATLPNLTRLGLISTKFNDDALREIANCSKLETLQIGGEFTDAGTASLSAMKNLKELTLFALGNSQISDESLSHFAALTNLEQLAVHVGKDFSSTSGSFSDAGLKHLATLTKLQTLHLSGDKITDAGLVHLYELSNLKELNVENTSVTQPGIDELQKHLPELKVKSRKLPPETPRTATMPNSTSEPVYRPGSRQ